MDRTSYYYRFDRALARGRTLPEPQNEEQRRYRDRRLRDRDEKRRRAEAERAAVKARPVVALDVTWTAATLTAAEGTCAHPDVTSLVYLNRTRFDVVVQCTGDDELAGRPWTLCGHLMPKPLRVVPTTPDPRFRSVDPSAVTIPVLNSEVPDADADAIFDALGVQPMALQRKWERMAPSARIAAQGKWRRDWAKRHGRPHPDDWPGGSTPTVPSDEERTRDDQIAAAMRSYHGPRTKRQGWPYLRNLRRHAGIPISASDRARVWRTLGDD